MPQFMRWAELFPWEAVYGWITLIASPMRRRSTPEDLVNGHVSDPVVNLG